MKKCIVGHAGSRDFYQVALSLYEHDLLETLVTDFFIPDFIAKFSKRSTSGLPFNLVTSSRVAFWNFLREKLPGLPAPVNFSKKDSAISKSCLKYALSRNCNLFLYSYYANEAFSYLESNGYPNKRILFQLHPHPLSIRQILFEEVHRLPYTKSSIEGEAEFSISTGALEKLSNEIHLSDYCVAASSFTKRTLVENGADPEKISVIPYGVDSVKFPQKIPVKRTSNESLKIVFIGSMVQRKGLADLLLALKILNHHKVELTLIGYRMDKDLLHHFAGLNVKIIVRASHTILIEQMHLADVFVLPSLAEGFAHVILEAMSTGLPVITTFHTAGPDLITEGKEGFLIPVKSPEIIAEKLELLLRNDGLCKFMGESAAIRARELNWSLFRSRVRSCYQSLNNLR